MTPHETPLWFMRTRTDYAGGWVEYAACPSTSHPCEGCDRIVTARLRFAHMMRQWFGKT